MLETQHTGIDSLDGLRSAFQATHLYVSLKNEKPAFPLQTVDGISDEDISYLMRVISKVEDPYFSVANLYE